MGMSFITDSVLGRGQWKAQEQHSLSPLRSGASCSGPSRQCPSPWDKRRGPSQDRTPLGTLCTNSPGPTLTCVWAPCWQAGGCLPSCLCPCTVVGPRGRQCSSGRLAGVRELGPPSWLAMWQCGVEMRMIRGANPRLMVHCSSSPHSRTMRSMGVLN